MAKTLGSSLENIEGRRRQEPLPLATFAFFLLTPKNCQHRIGRGRKSERRIRHEEQGGIEADLQD